MKLTRKQVYDLIDGERDYQDKKWQGEEYRDHSIEEWLIYMEDYINEAKHYFAREPYEIRTPKGQAIMRKIAAMAVCAMESNGAPPRE